MSLFPRAFQQELSPLFRMVEDYASLARSLDAGFPFQGGALSQLRSFTPKFDVSETPEAYTLHGELPGIASKDVRIEWADGNTLTVSGRTEHSSETGTAPETAAAESTSTGALEAAADGQASETHSNYEKPSIEDEAGPSSTTAPAAEGPEQAQAAEATPGEVAKTNAPQDVSANVNKPRYWVSERSVGQFHRSFSFPARVDQENVSAKLKDGILEVTVPKAAQPTTRRIEVQ